MLKSLYKSTTPAPHADGGKHLGHRPDEGRALAAVAVGGEDDPQGLRGRSDEMP